MRSPRSSRIWPLVTRNRSMPSNRISPPAMRPGGCGTKPMIDSAVTLLPHPDSPTMPRVRPVSSDRLMPSTAGNSPPPSTANQVLRSRISSRGGPAALVAARRFAGLHRRNQPFGEGQIAAGVVRLRGVLDHLRPRQHIARHRIPVTRDLAAPLDALDAGMRGDIAFCVDDVQLPMLATGIGLDQRVYDVSRLQTLRQHREAARAVEGVDQSLRRQRADAAVCVRTQRADGE